jgi:hypothetical protein
MQDPWLCRFFSRLVLGLLLVSGLGTALGKEYQFAIIPKLRAPWFNRLEVGAKKAAQDLGLKTYMQAPASADEAEQARLIQDAISRGVDAILVVPNNAQSLEPVFAQAKQAGIAVITHESPNQKNADFDIEMINNEKFGQAALELLAQGLGGKGDFVVYVGSLTVPPFPGLGRSKCSSPKVARGVENLPQSPRIPGFRQPGRPGSRAGGQRPACPGCGGDWNNFSQPSRPVSG